MKPLPRRALPISLGLQARLSAGFALGGFGPCPAEASQALPRERGCGAVP
ncbi:hypothetical protein [Acidithiobacillus ferrivorans]|nr:hypothetical protein [Acidithiobacillus ferrivorans]